MSEIRELRMQAGLTQQQAANLLGISVRSYISYENEIKKAESLKYGYISDKLKEICTIDEEHGVLSKAEIEKKCHEVFKEYPVQYCILFGSYAKGTANATSDVDLLISTELKGLRYFGMIEEIREKLHKKVDVLDLAQLKDNLPLTDEILKDGIRIYG